MQASNPPGERDEDTAEAPTEERSSLPQRARRLFLDYRNHTKPNEELVSSVPLQRRDELLENLRLDIARRSVQLREAEADLRQVTTTIGSMVYAIVQERTNRSNLWLQMLVATLTVVMTVLTIVTTVNSCEFSRSTATSPQETTLSGERAESNLTATGAQVSPNLLDLLAQRR